MRKETNYPLPVPPNIISFLETEAFFTATYSILQINLSKIIGMIKEDNNIVSV